MKVSKGLIRLLTNRGFYILLALTLGVVAAAGYVRNLKDAGEFEMSASRPQGSPVPISELVSEAPPFVESAGGGSPSGTAAAAPGPAQVPAIAPVAAVPEVFLLPMQGVLGKEFSGDELVYDRTMGDWRVHNGIDILGDVGTQVKTCADGKVTRAYENEMTGVTIVITHSGGFESIYCNLQPGVLVDEGQAVSAGTPIGGVGNSAADSVSEEPHLHFSLKKDGEFVNPFDYIN